MAKPLSTGAGEKADMRARLVTPQWKGMAEACQQRGFSILSPSRRRGSPAEGKDGGTDGSDLPGHGVQRFPG